MKNLIIIVFLLLVVFFSSHASAQSIKGYYQPNLISANKYSLEVGVQTNRSIRGWRSGWNIDMAISNKFRIGYFNTVGKGSPEQDQHSDQGMELSFMFNTQGSVSFGPQLKVTVTDKRFISAIPMLQTRVAFSRRIAFKGGIGMSDRYPVFEGGVIFKLR